MRLLDLGCGAGTLPVGLGALVAPGEVLGFDISESAIGQARAALNRATSRNT